MKAMPAKSLSEHEMSISVWLESRCQTLLMRALMSRLERTTASPSKIPECPTQLMAMDPDEVFPDEHRQTMLHAVFTNVADQSDLAMFVSALLEMGANVNSRNANNQTPLMLAVLHKAPQEILLLLLNAPDISLELQDKAGNTALIYAVQTSSPGTVRLLADFLVKRNQFSVFLLRSSAGITAEQIAEGNGEKIKAQILNKRRLKLLSRITAQLQDKGHKTVSYRPSGTSKGSFVNYVRF